MRNLYLIKSTDELHKEINHVDYVLLNLDNLNEDYTSAEPVISRITLDGEIDKTAFEKKYLDFIASLGKEVRSDWWWASVLSEKNDLTSKLFDRLYRLLCLDNTIKKMGNKDIIIVSSDQVLVKQIIFNYKERFTIRSYTHCYIKDWVLHILKGIKGHLLQLYKAVDEYKKLLLTRRILEKRKSIIENKADYVVLRTWVDHRNYKSQTYVDPYFGNLPQFLSAQKKNVLIFAATFSDYKNILKQFHADNKNLIIPYNFYLYWTDILRCLVNTYFRRPLVKRPVFFENLDITHIISFELSLDMAEGFFFNSLIQYYSCIRLAEFISIERFIYTFENYAWEKMSILGLRRQNSNIRIIGFQHAFISRNSFKYFPGSGEDKIMPLPDRIITLGEQTKEIMKRFGNYPEAIFFTGCALRQEYLFNLNVLPRGDGGGIFVPMTITIEDTVKVIRFLLVAGLDEAPEKVYLRFHPGTPVRSVIDALGFNVPDNFIISDNPPMPEEIKRCSVVLYTWTTVCLEALKMGRPVIYLDVNYPLEVDPLFECTHLKDSCRYPQELLHKIDKIRKIDDKTFNTELAKSEEYLAEYFYPVNEEYLSAFIF